MPNDAQIPSEQLIVSLDYGAVLKLVESDHLLVAVEAAKNSTALTEEERQRILDLAAYTVSPEAYQAYYRGTMRGGVCLEKDLFSKHLLVRRFAGIRERILARKQLRVLDLGCLDGWALLNLAAGGVTGVGVDLNPQALEIAQARAQKYRFDLKFIEAAIEAFDAEDPITKFDAVILSEVLEHVLDPAKCIKVAARHLAPGGMLYISAPVTPIPHFGKTEDAVLHLRVLTENELVEMARQAGLAAMVDRETLEMEDQGQKFAHLMISFRRARVAIHTNHITGGWDPADKASLNGSEEAVVQVAEQWAADGHEVSVYLNSNRALPTPVASGVTYRHRDDPLPDGLDYLVLFKNLDRIGQPARAKVYWTIDLPESAGGGAGYLPPAVAEQLDAVACVSEWHRQRVLEACPWVPPGKVVQHWLGVDPEEIRQAREAVPEPVRHRVVYASSLDRGAIDLLRLWPRVREKVPDAELRVLYGLEFWKRSEAILQEPARSQMITGRQELERLLRQEGVTFVGRPATREAYLREIASASVWAYPCNGGELCCKVALEVQALGVLPVVIPTMALSETVQIGYRATSLENFEECLIAALAEDCPGFKVLLGDSKLHIPTWQDLSVFLWGLAQEKLRGAIGSTDAVKVPQAAKEEEPLPERFAIPAPSPTMPKVNLDVIFHVNGMPFDGTTDKLKSLGGSETAGLQLARALAKRGHHMTVFSNCDVAKKIDGVTYIPLGEFPRYVGCTSHDVCVIQRAPVIFNMPIASKLNVLWMHDLGLLRYTGQTRSSLWNVDYVVPVSHWHGRQLCQVYGLDPEIVAPMRNGIECEWIRPRSTARARNRKGLVYAARPERGLDLLLEKVLPKLLERDPQVTLSVAGYDNTVPEMQDFYNYCNGLCERYSPRVRRMGALKKPDLYSLYRNSGCYAYPTRGFEEVNCLSLAEAAAAGLPFIASAWGALPETASYCPGAVQLVPFRGGADDQYITEFVDAVWKVISDPGVQDQMSAAGVAGAKVYDWELVAAEWEAFLLGALEMRGKDQVRTARHFWRIGDTYGAQELTTNPPLPPDTGPGDLPQSVLDAIANSLGPKKPKTILPLGRQSEPFAQQIAASLGAKVVTDELADAVLGIETLDCSPDPGKHVRDAETHCISASKSSGTVCLVTAGPAVQAERIFLGGPRQGRWVFDQHDIRDLLGRKPDLLALVVGGGRASQYDGVPLSWSVYSWKAGSGPTGAIDHARRKVLQSPRLSLSAAMITYNAEGMLHRCLGSFMPYVDELVACDQGSTDSTREILARHGAKIIQGIDPVLQGFDEARNVGLPHVTGDLILWIDSDEELLEASNLPKYLRWNMFNGYALRQHHFSAVPENAFKPDLPVRVFRRLGLDGMPIQLRHAGPAGIRFYGVVHEHPEVEINQSVGESICLSDVHISHVGYLTESVRRRRFDRNIQLMFRDRAKYPQRNLGKLLMIRDWCHLARYTSQQAGGRMTPEVVGYYETAVKMYQDEFLGQVHTMAVDGLAYYNEALSALRRGFEVNLVLQVGWVDNTTRDVNYRGRVASVKDLQILLERSSRELASVWEGKYI